ncbi:MAG: hypothetical protein IKU51_06905 [Clostridia bacterium]|nr:hypothetical protein [Clostridia bacterium]
MGKLGKMLLWIVSIVMALAIGAYFFIVALWNGAFDFMLPSEIVSREIASYTSPDGEYSLVFEQVGDPDWPFGSTEIRLTLKNGDGEIVERVSASLHDDGANAGEHNVASVQWDDEGVTVVLRASEMENKEVVIGYSD